MNQINPRKLLLSKWTAVSPVKKRKHFIVIKLVLDEITQDVVGCILQAVIDKYEMQLDWRKLKNSNTWRQGWK